MRECERVGVIVTDVVPDVESVCVPRDVVCDGDPLPDADGVGPLSLPLTVNVPVLDSVPDTDSVCESNCDDDGLPDGDWEAVVVVDSEDAAVPLVDAVTVGVGVGGGVMVGVTEAVALIERSLVSDDESVTVPRDRVIDTDRVSDTLMLPLSDMLPL
jgi:hypothetical protein